VRRRQFKFINANIAARGHVSILSDSPLVTIWAAKAGQRRSSYTVPGFRAVSSQAAVTRLASLKRAPDQCRFVRRKPCFRQIGEWQKGTGPRRLRPLYRDVYQGRWIATLRPEFLSDAPEAICWEAIRSVCPSRLIVFCILTYEEGEQRSVFKYLVQDSFRYEVFSLRMIRFPAQRPIPRRRPLQEFLSMWRTIAAASARRSEWLARAFRAPSIGGTRRNIFRKARFLHFDGPNYLSGTRQALLEKFA